MAMANNSANTSGLLNENLDPENPQTRLLLMTHNNSVRPVPSFQRRTADSARQFRDNLSNVIREIQPLVETARTVNAGVQNAISITSFLNRSQPQPQSPEQQGVQHHQNNSTVDSNSFVITLDDVGTGGGGAASADISLNNSTPDTSQDNNNTFNYNDTDDPNNSDRAQTIIEAQQYLQVILKYVPFFLILSAKAVYDYHEAIFILIILFTTFAHTNSAVKKEATKRHRRSISTLAVELVYIFVCFLFLHFVFNDELHNFNVVFNLVLIRTFIHPLTVGSLLWIVTITDFALKLITVTLKILLTMLPGRIVPFQKRGKLYLFIEAVSQLYRSIATIQPWLNYLLESYQGPEKIVTVFLFAFYMISKGSDLMSKMKLLKTASLKLLQNVTVGSSPSKEQIQTAGEHCPICHDQYESPVLLTCRHIFCENCVTTWFDREQTCPLCRAKIVDDPSWRDGSTSYFIQLF